MPTGLTLMPDGSALVGERDTGRILQVFPNRSPARELMTVPGIDISGDGGLLGLALSPTFLEDGLVYAYMTTATDNRVVRFPIGGIPNPVFTGIPRGAVHNGGALVFDLGRPSPRRHRRRRATPRWRRTRTRPPARSCASTSSASRSAAASSSAGATATSPPSAPTARTAIYATDAATDAATTGPDEINTLTLGRRLRAGAAAGRRARRRRAASGAARSSGSAIFLGALDGERIHALAVDGTGAVVGDPEEFLGGEYGRLRTVVLDPEGALWITTSNRDGIGTPAEDDDKVLRIMPPTVCGQLAVVAPGAGPGGLPAGTTDRLSGPGTAPGRGAVRRTAMF